jgi:hypothetical protein
VTNERNSIRPTLDVNGIWGGYTGAGAKQLSQVKRLLKSPCVPNQEWEHITELFTKHFMSIAPDSVTVKLPHHGGQGMWPLLTASVTRPLTWLIRRLWSSGYSCSFWRKYSIVALFEKN